MPNADGTPTTEEIAVARVRGQNNAAAQHFREVEEVIRLGQETYGRDQFDSDSQVVAEKLGARKDEFLAVARQFDSPHKLIKHFADRPGELDTLAKLPTTRMMTEIARIEGRSAPYGHATTRADPLWKSSASNQRLSNEDWNRGVPDTLSDAEFDRQYCARQRERAERRGGWR
jgi:hypothetical protein